MVVLILERRFATKLSQYRRSFKIHTRALSTRKTIEPLRILYCGSDEFSAVSLRALHQESTVNPDLISSIDVVCKAGKPAGRGLKHVRHGTHSLVSSQVHCQDQRLTDGFSQYQSKALLKISNCQYMKFRPLLVGNHPLRSIS